MRSEHAGIMPNLAALYDEDFFEWTQWNAELLRAGQTGQADIAHIAEEIEDMGKRDLKELNSRLQVLLMHLLKWQLQPEMRSRSWERTIIDQRLQLETLLEQSPSLRPRSQAYLESNYEKAVHLAAFETRIPASQFPSKCPFSMAQILDRDFMP